MTEKALLRKEKLAARRELSSSQITVLSESICRNFLASREYKAASTILLYKAYNNEVDTDEIFKKAISDGKTVAYPVSAVVNGEPEMSFFVVTGPDQFREGFKGIPEPDTETAGEMVSGSADICVTPGAVYDRNCNRIGYGMAFYDRYIRLNAPKTVIGLAFDLQIVNGFEAEDGDVPVDMVITESEIIRR